MILMYMSVTNYDGNNKFIQYVQERIENTTGIPFKLLLLKYSSGHAYCG